MAMGSHWIVSREGQGKGQGQGQGQGQGELSR